MSYQVRFVAGSHVEPDEDGYVPPVGSEHALTYGGDRPWMEAGSLSKTSPPAVFSSVPQAQWALEDFCNMPDVWVRPENLEIVEVP